MITVVSYGPPTNLWHDAYIRPIAVRFEEGDIKSIDVVKDWVFNQFSLTLGIDYTVRTYIRAPNILIGANFFFQESDSAAAMSVILKFK